MLEKNSNSYIESDFIISGDSPDRFRDFNEWKVFERSLENGKWIHTYVCSFFGPMSFIAAAAFVEYRIKHGKDSMSNAVDLFSRLQEKANASG